MNSFGMLISSKTNNYFRDCGTKLWDEYALWEKALDAISCDNAVEVCNLLQKLKLQSHLLILNKNGRLKRNPLISKLNKILKKEDWEFLSLLEKSQFAFSQEVFSSGTFERGSEKENLTEEVWYPSSTSLFKLLCVVKPKLFNEVCSIWAQEALRENDFRYFEELFILTDFNGKSYFNKDFKCAWDVSWYSYLTKKGIKEIYYEMQKPDFSFEEAFKRVEDEVLIDCFVNDVENLKSLKVKNLIQDKSVDVVENESTLKFEIGKELFGVLKNISKIFWNKRVKLYKSMANVKERSCFSGADISFQKIGEFNLTSQKDLKETSAIQIAKSLSEKDYKIQEYSDKDFVNNYVKKVKKDFEIFLGLMWGSFKDYNYESATNVCVEYMKWVENLHKSKSFFKEKHVALTELMLSGEHELAGNNALLGGSGKLGLTADSGLCPLNGSVLQEMQNNQNQISTELVKLEEFLKSFTETLPKYIPIEKTIGINLSNIRFLKNLNKVLNENKLGQWLASLDKMEFFYIKIRVGESMSQMELLNNFDDDKYVLLKKATSCLERFSVVEKEKSTFNRAIKDDIKSDDIIGEHFFKLKFSDLLVLTCNSFMVSGVKESLNFGVKLGDDLQNLAIILQKLNEMPEKSKNVCQMLGQIVEDKSMSEKMISSLQSCLIASALVQKNANEGFVSSCDKVGLQEQACGRALLKSSTLKKQSDFSIQERAEEARLSKKSLRL